MKNIIKRFATMLFATLLFAGCNEDAVEPLTGKYPIPDNYILNTVSSTSNTPNTNESAQYFNVKLTGQNRETLSAQFLCEGWFLGSGAYTMAPRATAQIGNFIAENTTWNDGTKEHNIKSGSIFVTKNENNYGINSVLTMEDGSVTKTFFSGKITYVRPAPTNLTKCLVASTSNNTVTLKLGTDGLTPVWAMWYWVISGTGTYASIDLVTTDGTLATGVYTPAANDKAAAGNFVMGYDLTEYNIPDLGSCWFNVVNDAAIGKHMETGTVTVEKNNETYTITIDCGSVYAQYIGAITF